MSTQEQIEFRQDIIEVKKILSNAVKRHLFETKEDLRKALTVSLDSYVKESSFQLAGVLMNIDSLEKGGLKIDLTIGAVEGSGFEPVQIEMTLTTKTANLDFSVADLDEDKDEDQ